MINYNKLHYYQQPIKPYLVEPLTFGEDYPIVPLTVDNGVTIPMTVKYPAWFKSKGTKSIGRPKADLWPTVDRSKI